MVEQNMITTALKEYSVSDAAISNNVLVDAEAGIENMCDSTIKFLEGM